MKGWKEVLVGGEGVGSVDRKLFTGPFSLIFFFALSRGLAMHA